MLLDVPEWVHTALFVPLLVDAVVPVVDAVVLAAWVGSDVPVDIVGSHGPLVIALNDPEDPEAAAGPWKPRLASQFKNKALLTIE